MNAINRDTIVAIVLLLICAGLYSATFDIRALMAGTAMGPELWPRIVIGFMGALSLIYLFQSVRGAARSEPDEADEAVDEANQTWARFINPLLCVGCFLVFLLLIPLLGFLVGGFVFLFALLTLLGGLERSKILKNLMLSVGTIAVIWFLFVFLLRMYLPAGSLIRLF